MHATLMVEPAFLRRLRAFPRGGTAWLAIVLAACDAPAPAPPPPNELEGPFPDLPEVITPTPPELGPVPTGEEWLEQHPDAPALVSGTYDYLERNGFSREYQTAHLRVRHIGGITVVVGGRTLVLDWVVAGRSMRVELPGLALAGASVEQLALPEAPKAAPYLSIPMNKPLRPFRPVQSLVRNEVIEPLVRGCEPTIFTGRLIVTPWLDDDGRWTVEFRDGVVDGTVMVAKLDLETGKRLQCARIPIIHE